MRLENLTYTDKKRILDQAELESELSDLKQHADKMIRGFENFNDSSSNRAIWELVQNACDLSVDCKITIDYRNDKISFTHNGKPFTTKALISLIKQVSGKYGEEEEIPEVGKYGTGFISTHSFGRKFIINSILEAGESYLEINNFSIDRCPKEWVELSKNIKNQKEKVFDIIREFKLVPKPSEFITTFTYLPETVQEKEYINTSIIDLYDYVPFVLTINRRLKEIKIIDKIGVKTSFVVENKKLVENDKEINIYKTTILKNEENLEVYSLLDKENEIEIILPVNKDLELYEIPDRIGRLFLYYPLIGSEKFGFNFIINCNKFLPNEPRNGIHLKSNKDQVQDQEKDNQKLLKIASNLIFGFLRSNVLKVNNPLYYAKVNFVRDSENTLLNEYFEDLQSEWNTEFKKLPFVETLDGFKAINDVIFFDEELFIDLKAFDATYRLVSKFHKNIPVKEICKKWTEYVQNYEDEEIKFLGHEALVESISERSIFEFEKCELITYYQSLIDEDRVSLFSEYKILPNLNGDFCLLNSLVSPVAITPNLIELGNVLIPEIIVKLISRDFKFNFRLEKFTRKDFSNSVKIKLDEINAINQICLPKSFDESLYRPFKVEDGSLLNVDFYESLIKYCKLSNTIESQSKPTQLLLLISSYYGLDEELIHLPKLSSVDENLETRASRKILVKIFFNLLSKHNEDWVKANIRFLTDIANCQEDSLKEVYSDSRIFPNQVYELREIKELKRDVEVLEEIKDLYDKVNGGIEIRTILAYDGFNTFLDEENFINNKWLTSKIEDVFFETDIRDINDHKFKEEILNIISKLNTKTYKELFTRLDDNKAKLMLDVVTNEKTKDDIFSIVTLREEKLKILGQLVQHEDFTNILRRAESLVEQDQHKKSDFQHKYKIGTNIERLVRDKLTSELQDRITFKNDKNIQADDIQGGQDIIVNLDDNPIYFIEVKSRWASDSSVSMSKLQLQRAVEKSERYSLCSVDISKYTGQNDRYDLSIEEIIPLMKFVKDIGANIEPLIEGNLLAEKNIEESIHLIDYRGIIPQEIIKNGSDFNDFINLLLTTINKILELNK